MHTSLGIPNLPGIDFHKLETPDVDKIILKKKYQIVLY